MIVTKQRLLNFVLSIFLLTTTSINPIDAAAGRCYLCSQNTLAECAGSVQLDSPLYAAVLQYYTEPCNGQCVLFRNENTSTIRGCSWTYGHMKSKSTGWHELSPGIRAYFCDSYLCNNGTYEQPDTAMIRAGTINNDLILLPQQTLSPQQLFIMGGNTLPVMNTGMYVPLFSHESDTLIMYTKQWISNHQHLPPINNIPRQLRQCYSCTARSTGCGEFLDPQYVSKYIRPCTSSCIIFRNPSDHNLITRDCATTWPQVHAKSGLHKLLGSDAFFCQESLCNGISFDFIMGIFHNQLPAVITFSPTPIIEESTTINIINPPATTATIPIATTTTTEEEEEEVEEEEDSNDNVVWEDPDLDFVLVEPTTTTVSIPTTSLPLSTELPDDTDFVYLSSTIPLQPVEHFDFIEKIPASSTIAGGIAVAGEDSQFNWWDVDEASFSPLAQPNSSPSPSPSPSPPPLLTTTILPSTIKLTTLPDDDWSLFNKTSTPSVTKLDHLSNVDVDIDMNDHFPASLFSTTSSTEVINNNNSTTSFVPYYFTDYKTKDQLLDILKPSPTLVMPPFSWMLHLAKQNKTHIQGRQSLINRTKISENSNKIKRLDSKSILDDHFYDHCNKKQCQNGGRLNADCLCICLPAFNGDNCEIVRCNQEPAHICNFVLEHECKSDYVRYLCPKFCQMKICSSNKLS